MTDPTPLQQEIEDIFHDGQDWSYIGCEHAMKKVEDLVSRERKKGFLAGFSHTGEGYPEDQYDALFPPTHD